MSAEGRLEAATEIRRLVVGDQSGDGRASLTVRRAPVDSELHSRRWRFDALEQSAVAEARVAFIEFLRVRGAQDDQVSDAALVYLELIGNVVRYAPGPVEVVVEWHGECPILHVLDEGPGFHHVPHPQPDVLAESGRGLFLVATLAKQFHVWRRPVKGSHARAVLSVFAWPSETSYQY